MSFFQGIRLVMGHGPYAKLVMVFLFTSLAFMVRFFSPKTLFIVISAQVTGWLVFPVALSSDPRLFNLVCMCAKTGLSICLILFQLLEGNFALFCTYTLGFRKDFQNILLVIMVS